MQDQLMISWMMYFSRTLNSLYFVTRDEDFYKVMNATS